MKAGDLIRYWDTFLSEHRMGIVLDIVNYNSGDDFIRFINLDTGRHSEIHKDFMRVEVLSESR